MVLSVAGEVDIATAPTLHAALEHPDLDGVQHILVDLSDTSFLESSGLRVLLMASQRTSRRGSLSIVCPSTSVRRVFELTGLAGVLALHEDRKEALAWHHQRTAVCSDAHA
jgi:anti-sigma B factor antagonist